MVSDSVFAGAGFRFLSFFRLHQTVIFGGNQLAAFLRSFLVRRPPVHCCGHSVSEVSSFVHNWRLEDFVVWFDKAACHCLTEISWGEHYTRHFLMVCPWMHFCAIWQKVWGCEVHASCCGLDASVVDLRAKQASAHFIWVYAISFPAHRFLQIVEAEASRWVLAWNCTVKLKFLMGRIDRFLNGTVIQFCKICASLTASSDAIPRHHRFFVILIEEGLQVLRWKYDGIRDVCRCCRGKALQQVASLSILRSILYVLNSLLEFR